MLLNSMAPVTIGVPLNGIEIVMTKILRMIGKKMTAPRVEKRGISRQSPAVNCAMPIKCQ